MIIYDYYYYPSEKVLEISYLEDGENEYVNYILYKYLPEEFEELRYIFNKILLSCFEKYEQTG